MKNFRYTAILSIFIVLLFIQSGISTTIKNIQFFDETDENIITDSDDGPFIVFKKDDLSYSLIVIACEDNLIWRDVRYWDGSNWEYVPGHNEGAIMAGDKIACNRQNIQLLWAPNNVLLGSWMFQNTYDPDKYLRQNEDNQKDLKTSQTINPEWTYTDNSYVFSVAVSGNGEYIAVKTSDYVHFFDKDSNTPLWSKSTGNNMGYVAISSTGLFIAVSAYNELRLYDRDGDLEWSKTVNGHICSVDMSDSGYYIIIGSWDNNVYLFKYSSSTPYKTYSTSSDVNSVAICDSGSYMVAGTSDNKLYCFYKENSNPEWIYTDSDDYFDAESVAISPDGENIVAGDTDGDIYFFHRSDGNIPKDFDFTGDCIKGIDINNNNYVAVGSYNNNLYCYYIFNDNYLIPYYTYDGATAHYNEICINDARVVGACSSPDDNIRCPFLWNYETGDGVLSVSTSDSGEQVAGGGYDNILYFFDMNTITFYTDPSSIGEITFDDDVYQNDDDTHRPDGDYSITATPESNYVFDHWGQSGGVSISNPYSQSTSATITSDGGITVYFNRPPYTPSNPDPYNGESDVDINHDLYWDGGDPDGDTVYFDVYLEAGDPTPDIKVADDITDTSFNPGTMIEGITYYWKIEAIDEHGEPANPQGPIWHFTTHIDQNNPPYTPSNPDPYNGESDVDINHDLYWDGGDPDGDTVYYDVYLEAEDPTPDIKVADDITDTSFNPGTLNEVTTYYWKIEAIDEHGEPANPQGPIWHFTTGSEPNYPPTVEITHPDEGQTVSGTITITGIADDPDGSVTKVEVKIDNDDWQIASGTTSWSISWDTNSVPYGQHTISARSYDGESYSEIDSVTVNVNNNPDSFTIIHITDLHIGSTGALQRVGDVLHHINNLNPKPDMIVMTGDLVDWGCFYLSPFITRFGVFVPPHFPDIGKMNYMNFISLIDNVLDDNIQIYVCPGNHDYRYGDCNYLFWHPYYWTFNPTWWLPGIFNWHLGYSLQNYCNIISPEINYENEYKNTLLVSLDSGHDTYDPSWNSFRDIMNFITDGIYPEEGICGTGLSNNQISDLDTWLSSTSAENKIVFMHHPAINYEDRRTISNNKEVFINKCEENDVEIVLTGHTHGFAVYDKEMNNYPLPGEDWPIHSNIVGKTLYIQTPDCGQDSVSFRIIEINGDDVIIYNYNNLNPLANLYLSGPADIHVYNQKGDHVGLNDNKEHESEINGVTYGHLDSGEEFASVYYGEDDYRFEIHGTGEGKISFNFKIIMKDGNTTEIKYENIQVTEDTIATLYVYKDSIDQTLYMDYNDDHRIDEDLKSLSILKSLQKNLRLDGYYEKL